MTLGKKAMLFFKNKKKEKVSDRKKQGGDTIGKGGHQLEAWNGTSGSEKVPSVGRKNEART